MCAKPATAGPVHRQRQLEHSYARLSPAILAHTHKHQPKQRFIERVDRLCRRSRIPGPGTGQHRDEM